MKIGLIPINVGFATPEPMVALAKRAEALGFESVWTFEHVIVPVEYDSKYPYSKKGKMPVATDTPFVDPLIALSYLAAATTTLRLGTGVNILPQTNPLLAAKQVASLDMLSGGRFLYGVGVGWLAEEYAAMGVPFERRGARFDEYLVAMKEVWTGEVVEHEGELLRWSGWKSLPRPARTPHPPILVGGTSETAMRRVVRYGDGYIAPNDGVEPLRDQLALLRRVAEENGRDPASVEITAMWPYAKQADRLGELAELGVSRAIVPLPTLGSADPSEALERVMETVRASGLG